MLSVNKLIQSFCCEIFNVGEYAHDNINNTCCYIVCDIVGGSLENISINYSKFQYTQLTAAAKGDKIITPARYT